MNKILQLASTAAFIFAGAQMSNAQCPTITCPTNISTNVDPGTCGAVVSYTAPTADDLCAGSGNILFVCDGDNTTATEIPTELTAAGYNVTSVYNDHDAATHNNTVLQGAGLAQYDAIYWHASGAGGFGDEHSAATFTNLTSYVNAGGAIFITGYDVIASPTDMELITFMGGTGSTDGGSSGTETLTGTNTLTTGVTNIVGLTLNSPGDHDGLNNLQAGTVAVASTGSAGWTIRTLGAGEIAWVSTANYTGQAWPAWNTPGSGYNEALLNFAFNHATCTGGEILFVSDNAGATEIPTELTAQGYTVTVVTNDYSAGNNAVLQGGTLSQYDVIYWNAVGAGGFGETHNAATFTNLNTYVSNGGAVFVTGYDVIISPSDPNMIAFLGGTSSNDIGPSNGTIINAVNSLTDGYSNIQGMTVTAPNGDQDNLNGISGSVTVVLAGSAAGGAEWSLNTVGSGEIAWVSSGQAGTNAMPAWNTPGSMYHEALLNFAATHTCGGNTDPIVTMISGLASGATFPVGTTTVTYEATDYQGNNPVQCSFDVTVTDNEMPLADTTNLTALTSECSVTVASPTATDNCAGTITATTTDPTSYSAEGSYTITWSYDDGNGNIATQTQNVTIDDITAPVADTTTLTTLTSECSVTVVAPTATDNCAGTITATTTDPTSYSAQGSYTITWTYDDGNGNTSTQTQSVVIADVTAPTITAPADVNDLANAANCEASGISLGTPVDNDNCAVDTVYNDAPATFPLGTTVVTWTVVDEAGNMTTTTQNVTITSDLSGSGVATDEMMGNDGTIDLTVTGGASPYTFLWDDTSASTTEDLSGLAAGTYTVIITDANGCSDTATVIVGSQVGISDNGLGIEISLYPNPNNGEFVLAFSSQVNGQVMVTDAAGRLVFNQSVNGDRMDINLNSIERGLYTITVVNDLGKSSLRFVVK